MANSSNRVPNIFKTKTNPCMALKLETLKNVFEIGQFFK